MDRRRFLIDAGLTLTGVVAASALGAFPATPASAATLDSVSAEPVRSLVSTPRLTVTQLAMHEAGEYRVSGTIRLEAPTVEISGIANSQQISWSGAAGQAPMVVSFSSFESYDGHGAAPAITVRGGTLESLSITPIEF